MISYKLLLIIIIGSILNFSIFGINSKICRNCKFIIKDKNSSIQYSKCSIFSKVEPENKYIKKKNQIEFLVTENKVEEEIIKPKDYFFCSTARDSSDMCGIEGKKYEPIV